LDFLSFLALAGGTNRLSGNVRKELPLYAVKYPRTAQTLYKLNFR